MEEGQGQPALEAPPPDIQKTLIAALLLTPPSFIEGEVWFPVDRRWWNAWKEYVSFDDAAGSAAVGPPPGPIDNSALQGESELELKDPVREHSQPLACCWLR